LPKKHATRGGRPQITSLLRSNKPSPARRSIAVPHTDDARFLWFLLAGLEVGVASVSPAGIIRYANPRFIEMLQSNTSDEIAGAPLNRFVSAASWPSLNQALRMAINDRVQGQMEIKPHPGRPRTIQLSLLPIHTARETSIMITATEVTELVEKNKALRATEDSLHTLSARILQLQDEERRRIARDLHDITGQELAVVIMSLNRLANNLGKPEAPAAPEVPGVPQVPEAPQVPQVPEVNAQQILTESLALVHKIEDEIRTLSYVLHPPLLDEFGLRSALNWYAEGFSKRSGINVTVDAPHDLPRLSAEKETALFRVVQESLTNVLRHSDSSKARIKLRLHSERLQLSVEDEGKGISHQALEKIVEGTAAGVGTLGMRERIQQLGGTLKFNARAKGTQVVATLPLDLSEPAGADVEAPKSDASRNGPESLHRSKTKRILIVDDHDVTRQGIRALLQAEAGIEVCGEAGNGVEGVALAQELDPDLVIMDISMPGASGFTAATNLRKSGMRAKILFFTTHTFYEIERMTRFCGYEGFVTKTNAGRDLVRAVRAILAGHKFYDSEVIGGGNCQAAAKARAH
jgi:signal transduction histidine kinase/CheY-like chemotaxis protein